MSEEKGALELLIEYAKRTGRNATFEETNQSALLSNRQFMHGRMIWFADNTRDNRVFAAYSNPKYFGFQSIFSGVFIPIKAPKEVKLMVCRKIFLDNLNLSSLGKRVKFGDRKLDRKLLIIGSNPFDGADLLYDAKIQSALYSFLLANPLYRLVVNELYLDFIPSFEHQSYLGLVRMGWDTDNTIETLFTEIKKFERNKD